MDSLLSSAPDLAPRDIACRRAGSGGRDGLHSGDSGAPGAQAAAAALRRGRESA